MPTQPSWRPGTLILAIVCLVCALPSGLAHAQSFDELVQQAGEARQAGESERAIALLQQAHAIKPLPELLNNVGKVLEELGRYREALETYAKVVDNPEASPELRALDSGRMAVLQPKLNSAWLVLEGDTSGAALYVNGDQVNPTHAGELELQGTRHLIQQIATDGSMDNLLIIDLELGIRSQERLTDRGAAPPPSTLLVDLEGVEQLSLEGRRVAGEWTEGRQIQISGAPSMVGNLSVAGRNPVSAKLTLRPGESISLAQSFPPVQQSTDSPLPPVSAVSTSGSSAEPWAWVTLGVGSAIAVGGAVMLGMGLSEQGDIEERLEANTDEDGLVQNIKQFEVDGELRSATSLTSAGEVFLYTGAAVALGGLVWWAIDDASDESSQTAHTLRLGWSGVGLSLDGSF